jgi:ElaA protein
LESILTFISIQKINKIEKKSKKAKNRKIKTKKKHSKNLFQISLMPSTKLTPTPPLYFVVKDWNELTTQEAHDFYKIRCDVFIIEQSCLFRDVDGKDPNGVHVMGYIENPITQQQEMVAYCRVHKKGDFLENNSYISRVVVATKWRAYGYGHYLFDKAIEIILERFTMPCVIAAQSYLFNFYSSHGFKPISEHYMDDGILHVDMMLQEEDLVGDNAKFIRESKDANPDGLTIERFKTDRDNKQEQNHRIAIIQDE